MNRVFLAAALLAVAAAVPAENFTQTYVFNGAEGIMDITACRDNNIIAYEMAGTDTFIQLSAIEDFGSGFAATTIAEDDNCYVSQTKTDDIEQIIAELKANPVVTLGTSTRSQVAAVPEDEPLDYGSFVKDFCGDRPIAWMGEPTEVSEDEATEQEEDERILSLLFQRCCVSPFRHYYGGHHGGYTQQTCTYFTFTFPTGGSITFTWFFG